MSAALRERRLRALGIVPLRLRGRDPVAGVDEPETLAAATPTNAAQSPMGIHRLALQPDPDELRDPAVNAMYTALTTAVGKAGLQAVRVCDVVDDPTAAVIVFGAAPVPEGIPPGRILHVEALSALHADRASRRQLWEMMQALGRDGDG